MADWWLIPVDFQDAIHDHLWGLIDRVLRALPNHQNENGVTGALGQVLMNHPLETGNMRVEFDYRKFPDSTEEFRTGADGAFIVTVTAPGGLSTTKAALFQAKLCKEDVAPLQQTLSKRDAERLKEQVGKMVKVSDDAVGIVYTPGNIYVMDAEALNKNTANQLSKPLRGRQRLITLETYLGKWIPRCTRGDSHEDFVSMARTPGAFRHLLEMIITSRQQLLLESKPDLVPGDMRTHTDSTRSFAPRGRHRI